MTVAGECILTGAPSVCSDCGVDALTRVVVDGAVRTFCECGPYSRESDYLFSPGVAQDVATTIASELPDATDKVEALRSILTRYGVARTEAFRL